MSDEPETDAFNTDEPETDEPETGDGGTELDVDGCTLTVDRVDGRRVSRVRLQRRATASAEDDR